MQELITKTTTLLEALPYIQRFQGEVIVVKYGGSFMDSHDLSIREGAARDVVFLEAVGMRPVVVHGGGKAISRAMQASGLSPKFVEGIRLTDRSAVRVADRVLSSEINPQIVRAIEKWGGRAKGFSGKQVFRCHKLWLGSRKERIDPGYVGEVDDVDVERLMDCLRKGITPVVSPTARGYDGRLYNCNADTAAACTASALRAKRLVFMTDVPGLMRDPAKPESVISRLRVAQVNRLKETGVIEAGMIPKVDAAVNALKAGVDKVSFVDGRLPHSILLEIFTDRGVGTEIVA